MEDKKPTNTKEVKYPKSVYFIVFNQFCERFVYFGILAILPLYFVDILEFSETTATTWYHVLSIFANLFPLVSAIIADSLLGKFRTIFYISIIYTIGQLFLFASSVPTLQLPVRQIAILGLLLITFGGGGIKACISAFGGDQFKLPEQEVQQGAFFSLYYFAANAGVLISTILAPILRKDVRCFGQNTCYSLAYLVLTIMIIASGVIFIAGRRLYVVKKPEGNIIFKSVKCTFHALIRKIRTPSDNKRKHWLDYADDEYEISLINDLKSVVKVFKLFIPLPLFWALYEQQGSRWTFQATRTNGEVLGYLIKPDQFQVANALFVVILIPIFQFAIYPVIEKFFYINTPLRKLTVGGLLACLSFVISGLVEFTLEPTYAVQPSIGQAQVRIFNAVNCDGTITLDGHQYPLKALDMYQDLNVQVIGQKKLSFKVDYSDCAIQNIYNGTIEIKENKAFSWFIKEGGISKPIEDKIEKSRSGDPTFRALIYLYNNDENSKLAIKNERDSYSLTVAGKTEFTKYKEVNPGAYAISLNDTVIADKLNLKFGGVYTLLGYQNASNSKTFVKFLTVVEPNSVHMFWLLPQYIVITMGEIMFSVTGIEFAYSQAPDSMKSLLQAGWLLTVALGNLIVIIVAEARIFDRQMFEFFLFAFLMLVDMIIFAIMANYYKYVNITTDKKEENIALQDEMDKSPRNDL